MWAVLVFLLAALNSNLAAKILCVVPHPIRSHNILFHTIIESLSSRGHNVTFVSSVLLEKKVKNLTQIKLFASHSTILKSMDVNPFSLRFVSPIEQIILANNYGVQACDHQLSSEPMRNLIKSNSTFDVILTQAMLAESVAAGLSYRFKAPLILLSNIQANLWCNHLVGNVAPTSYTAHPALGFSSRMTFWERAINFVSDTIGTIHMEWFSIPNHQEIVFKVFGKDTPPIRELLRKTALVFTNDHFSLSYPRMSAPNMIAIGGVHVPAPGKLPPHLDEYMNASKDGVILFSMGSILKSSFMTPEKLDIFLKVFLKLKQNVLWKYEKDLPGKPDNVKILDWLPQHDILAHPNLKLFITHGGILSTIEAVTFGVPVVGIPVFVDQPVNMKNIVNVGSGIMIDFENLTVENLYTAIQTIVNNPKYRDAAQKQAQLIKDQPMTPMETTMWWIEYVLRHKGAPHLQLASHDLHFYQLHQIDVCLFLVATVSLLTLGGWFILLWVIKFLKSMGTAEIFLKKDE